MDEQTKYVNAYIENAVGIAHENLNTILQLKTQLKVSNDLVSEKDNQIIGLTNQINQLSERVQFLEATETTNQQLIAENQALANKASHIDTFSRQISNNNKLLQEKDKLIHQLTTDIEEKDKLISELKKKPKKTDIPVIPIKKVAKKLVESTQKPILPVINTEHDKDIVVIKDDFSYE